MPSYAPAVHAAVVVSPAGFPLSDVPFRSRTRLELGFLGRLMGRHVTRRHATGGLSDRESFWRCGDSVVFNYG